MWAANVRGLFGTAKLIVVSVGNNKQYHPMEFPCKHGIGLMFLYVQQPGLFNIEDQLPPHVAEWLGKREEKEVAK
jgi:hypothetical protein